MQMFLKKKQDIIDWLNKYDVQKYTLIESEQYSFVVDVNTDVMLIGMLLKTIPVKFNIVSGAFYCANNKLTQLNFAPMSCLDFDCSNNPLKSLEGCPEYIGLNLTANQCELESLEYLPIKVGSDYISLTWNELLGSKAYILSFKELKQILEVEKEVYVEREALNKELNKEVFNFNINHADVDNVNTNVNANKVPYSQKI